MLAGARRLDGGVQRQQIGLAGNALDQRHHFADLLGAGGKSFDHGVGAARLLGGLAGDLGRTRHLLGDVVDRGRKFLGRGGHRSDIGRCLGRGGGGGGGLPRGFGAAAAHRRGHALHLAGGDRDRLDDAADLALEAGGKFAPRRVALLLGALFGLGRSALARASAACAASASAVFWAAVSNSCDSLCASQIRTPASIEKDHGMQHHAAEIGAAGKDGGRKNEVQHQMVQRDRDRAGEIGR